MRAKTVEKLSEHISWYVDQEASIPSGDNNGVYLHTYQFSKFLYHL